MFSNFSEIRQAAREISDARVAIPMGHDASSIEALITAFEEGLSSAVIVGPAAGVRETLRELGRELPDGIEIVNSEDPEKAALEAVRLVRSGEASILMKGLLKTSIFQKAMLDKENGLRTGRILSHVVVLHIPRQDRLVAISDGGMNITPDEEAIRQIAVNASDVIIKLGAEKPLVALLAAIEVPNEKMPETVMFAKISADGIPGLSVAGPVAVDGAMDPEAAAIKGMNGEVAGRANVLITPDISCGNIFAKGLMYMANAEAGGIIAGAAAPVVMLSRSDKARTKLNSLALGVVVSGGNNG
ncbi:MAG: phosphate butyryltransferase [Candidatus Aegiribacteria sp.]|nr:phosphate butyryltransferase [Candidatus Aegiribacteria sp.]